MSSLPVHVESAAARPYGKGSRTPDGQIYLGALIDANVFLRLAAEIGRRGLDFDIGLERALVEGWLSPETVVVEADQQARKASRRALSSGGRASS